MFKIFVVDDSQIISEKLKNELEKWGLEVILTEDFEKVFDLFYRVDESRNKKTGGYGIGLNLVKNIVEKLGGQVLIRDNLNENNEIRGSIFEVRLPKSKEETL